MCIGDDSYESYLCFGWRNRLLLIYIAQQKRKGVFCLLNKGDFYERRVQLGNKAS